MYKSDEHTYKYKENNCNYEYQAIDPICTAVTETTKTTGNIPNGKYLPGDEYICEVKNKIEYHFFVVSTENDNVNLLMERNVYYNSSDRTTGVADSNNLGLVAWVSEVDYGCGKIGSRCSMNDKGPVTAMNYLHNATKDWSNVPNIVINYTDEGNTGSYGYGKVKTSNNITKITKKDGSAVTVLTDKEGYTNLKTRMPLYNEVHGIGKCLTYEENGNREGSCPLWLSNYLNNISYVTGDGLQNINEIYGYWTLSSYVSDSPFASIMDYHGSITADGVYRSNYSGVRPVISIPKLDIAN